jgi:hypothetical protein
MCEFVCEIAIFESFAALCEFADADVQSVRWTLYLALANASRGNTYARTLFDVAHANGNRVELDEWASKFAIARDGQRDASELLHYTQSIANSMKCSNFNEDPPVMYFWEGNALAITVRVNMPTV